MASSYDIVVSGTKAKAVVITPVNGRNGDPLGPDGNGANGECDPHNSKKCAVPAGPGQPGNGGFDAPPAVAGGGGLDAFAVTITCTDYSGDPLNIANLGGDGALGNTGGVGGAGSDGGNAGTQPPCCKQLVYGGIGGGAGKGGAAGNGGDAGGAGDIIVTYGAGLSGIPAGATSGSGTPGQPGTPGDPGTPGAGGMNSDGTQYDPGARGGPGAAGTIGKAGYAGSFTATVDKAVAPRYLKIETSPHSSV